MQLDQMSGGNLTLRAQNLLHLNLPMDFHIFVNRSSGDVFTLLIC